MKDHDRLRELLTKQMEGTLSPSEEEVLDQLMGDYSDEELSEVLEEVFAEVKDIDPCYYEHDWEAVRRRIISLPPAAERPPPGLWLPSFIRYAAAAVLLIVTGITLWLLQPVDRQQGPCGLKLPSKGDDVVRINMIHDKITFSVPRSWQYTLTLPDGSKVWLNAASSITYPRSFTGDSREVSIEGEAFFQIDSSSKPFYVRTNGRRIEAPGRSFNINAYEQEVIVRIDTLHSNSWREGYFAFREAGVNAVVSELARWYDWKVVYGSGVKPTSITASFCRNTPEAGALQELRSRGISFHKTGNQLTIL